jgi:hypothetical protein
MWIHISTLRLRSDPCGILLEGPSLSANGDLFGAEGGTLGTERRVASLAVCDAVGKECTLFRADSHTCEARSRAHGLALSFAASARVKAHASTPPCPVGSLKAAATGVGARSLPGHDQSTTPPHCTGEAGPRRFARRRQRRHRRASRGRRHPHASKCSRHFVCSRSGLATHRIMMKDSTTGAHCLKILLSYALHERRLGE